MSAVVAMDELEPGRVGGGIYLPQGSELELGLDKGVSFSKHFFAKYELGKEVGCGHFGYTCAAKA